MQLSIDNRLAIERLTALWALNECGLGGFMHAVSSPFTGILVGGISILMITLIAMHSEKLWPTILKSLTLVLLIKLAVSPHSPVTAYFAVTFQAVMGAALYGLFSVNKLTVVLLGMITFLESALQKLITMTIIYGESLWEAVDIYSNWVNQKLTFLESVLSSKTLVITFLLLYAICGLIAGLLINKVIQQMWSIEFSRFATDHIDNKQGKKPSKRRNRKRGIIVFWLVAVVVISVPFLFMNNDSEGWKSGVYLVSRSLLILLAWYLLIGPLLLKGIRVILDRRKSKFQSRIEHTLDLFPYLRSIIQHAWTESSSEKGFSRMQYFLAKSIVYSVHFNPSEE